MPFEPDGPEMYLSDYSFEERSYQVRGRERMIALDKELSDLRLYSNNRRNNVVVFDDSHLLFSLDLHGFTSHPAERAIKIFIKECSELKTGDANIIHGKGEVLSRLVPLVLDQLGIQHFQLDGFVTASIPGNRSRLGMVTDADIQEHRLAELKIDRAIERERQQAEKAEREYMRKARAEWKKTDRMIEEREREARRWISKEAKEDIEEDIDKLMEYVIGFFIIIAIGIVALGLVLLIVVVVKEPVFFPSIGCLTGMILLKIQRFQFPRWLRLCLITAVIILTFITLIGDVGCLTVVILAFYIIAFPPIGRNRL